MRTLIDRLMDRVSPEPTSGCWLWTGGTNVWGYGIVSGIPKAAPKKPAGHVKLFQAVIDDWNFSETEAATLLGFENVADIRDVLKGRRAVGQRDANDRLRAVLRIAADLSALYKDPAIVRDWLVQPQSKLAGATPKQLLTEGSMENLLLVKYYVSQLSGRAEECDIQNGRTWRKS